MPVAGGSSCVPLNITGLETDGWLNGNAMKTVAYTYKLREQVSLFMLFAQKWTKDTHLTYLKKEFGYLLSRSHDITGAIAPIGKKNNNATWKDSSSVGRDIDTILFLRLKW